jgi:methylmalonyl-CoA mutase
MTSVFSRVGYDEWLRAVEGQLGPPRQVEGIELEPLCTGEHPRNVRDAWIAPGRLTTRAGELSWIVCQSYGSVDPEKLKHYLKDDLANGVRGVCLRAGAARGLRSVQDYRRAFRDCDTSWRVLMLDAGAGFLSAGQILMRWVREAAPVPGNRSLLFKVDPLGELATRGSLPADLSELESDSAQLTRRVLAELPESRSLGVWTAPYREAGAEIDQELGIAMAAATHYLRSLTRLGLAPADIASQLTFFTAGGQNTFLEIAKLRALRYLWKGLQMACGVELPAPAWIHSAVLKRGLPATDPANNLCRVTIASFAAIAGGVDSFTTSGNEFAQLGSTTDEGRRLARNVQHILGLESHLGIVADPAKGSYQLETLTQRCAEGGWRFFQDIEGQGGALAALQSGWIQHQIALRWQDRRERIRQGEVAILGVNRYPDPDRPLQVAVEIADPPGTADLQPGATEVLPVRTHRDSEPFESTESSQA